MSDISNLDNVIDSRDVIKRIEELRGDQLNGIADESELEELNDLLRLEEEGTNVSDDWIYGATLVRDSYFKDYAQELADDLGIIPANVAWPMTCIDWTHAAQELQYDYTPVTFGGVTYWTR